MCAAVQIHALSVMSHRCATYRMRDVCSRLQHFSAGPARAVKLYVTGCRCNSCYTKVDLDIYHPLPEIAPLPHLDAMLTQHNHAALRTCTAMTHVSSQAGTA